MDKVLMFFPCRYSLVRGRILERELAILNVGAAFRAMTSEFEELVDILQNSDVRFGEI